MKIHRISKGINYSLLLFVLTSAGHALAMRPTHVIAPGKVYVGGFGGIGSSTKFDISQYGTAFYTEAAGGPLAVDAFGRSDSRTVGFIGAHVGYQAAEIFADPCHCQWSFVPAAELEGYYLGKNTFDGHLVNDEATRLPEHDFIVRYPLKTGVFLTNAVLSFNVPRFCAFHPYIGAGIGGAVLSVSGARATQIAPPEPGVNHYNSNTSDTASTFAGQVKLGFNFDLNKCTSVFVEYRWLYLSSTDYSFGSTVYPGHPVTANWKAKLDPQYYNMASIGIQYSI